MRKVFRLGVRILLGLATLAVVGALLLAWRLEEQPLDLAGLVPMAERVLTPSDGEVTVNIRELSLLRDGHALVLRARDIQANDSNGDGILTVPAARIYVSVGAFLTGGMLAPERILLEGVELITTLQEDGTVVIGRPGEPTAVEADSPETDTRQLLGLWEKDSRLSHLRQIDLTHGNLSVVAPKHGLAWRAPNVSASIIKSTEGLDFRGDGLMRQQRLHGKEVDRALGKVAWIVQAQKPPASDPQQSLDVAVEITLGQVDPTILTGIVPPLVGERGLEAPISGTLTASFAAGQMPSSAAFALTLGEGQISVPDNGVLAFDQVSLFGSVSLDEISVRLDRLILDYGGLNASTQLRLSGQAGRGPGGDILVTADVEGIAPAWLASLSPAFSRMTGVDVALSGSAQLEFDGEGRLREADLHLAGNEAAINLPKIFQAPVEVKSLQADVWLREYGAEWQLDELRLAFNDGGTVRVTGNAHRSKDGGAAEFAIVGQDFLVGTVHQFWPLPVSPPARDWVVKNIKSGKVPGLDASMSADIGSIGTPLVLSNFKIDARFPVRDATMSYWDPLPGATEVDADARITQSFFEAVILKGTTAGMTVTGGKILIDGLDKGKGHELLDLTIETDGPVADLMAILDRKPLHFARFLKLKPNVLKGSVSGTMNIAFPPVADLELDDVKISASGRSRNALLPGIAGGRDLDRTNVDFQVNKKELRLKGSGRVVGAPVKLSAHVPFATSAPYQGRYVLIGNLNNKQRARFGLESAVFQPPFFDGPAGVILSATQRRGGKTILDLEMDLTKAALSMAAVGWRKEAGGFAAGQAKIAIENEVIKAVESFQISGPGMRVAGGVRFGKDGRASVRLSPVKLGGGTDLPVTIRPLPKNGYEIELGKGRLDLRPVILANDNEATKNPAKAKGAEKDRTPLRIKLSGPNVRVRAAPPFHDMRGRLLLRGDKILDAQMSGRPGGGEIAEFRLSPNGNLLVTAGDAGALLHTLGLPGRLDGGRLELKGTAAADMSSIDANLQVSSFKLVEAPVMMRVLQLASITGPLELLAGSRGLQMTAIEAPFTLKNKRLTVKNGRTYGGALGVTFRGHMDIARQTLDFNGAVVPVYVLNSLLSAVPLVGDMLTGGEGFFAVSYSVNGKISDPQVSVNPLSLLAPGGLRRLLLD